MTTLSTSPSDQEMRVFLMEDFELNFCHRTLERLLREYVTSNIHGLKGGFNDDDYLEDVDKFQDLYNRIYKHTEQVVQNLSIDRLIRVYNVVANLHEITMVVDTAGAQGEPHCFYFDDFERFVLVGSM
jgi:hypothetical protein